MKPSFLVLLMLIGCVFIGTTSSQNTSENTTQNSTLPNITQIPQVTDRSWLTNVIERAISDWINTHILGAVNVGLQVLNILLLWTPVVPESISSVQIKIIEMLAPAYLLVLSWNAIEIMTSEVIANQAKARITVQNSLISMVLVASSLKIYESLLAASQTISKYLVDIQFNSTLSNTVTAAIVASEVGAFAIGMMGVVLLLLVLIIIFLTLRIYIVSLGILLFPIGIFMYFFSPLKKFGKLIISTILFFMFIQVILALIVFVMNALMAAPPNSIGLGVAQEMGVRAAIYVGGLFLLLVVPSTIFLQIILLILAPEMKLFSMVKSVAGAVTSAGGG
ncbi:hypothetical protein H0N99_03795 [Candidatus Micrarchaeota archaeon]|nr:hypothetical protein [Candidatus Micrarchaeota archaeon]